MDQRIGKRSESVGSGLIRDVQRPPCRSTVTHASPASPHVADVKSPAGRRSQVHGLGVKGHRRSSALERRGGGRTRFLEIVLLAGDRRKTEGKVPVVEIGVSPGPSPFLLPTERVGWGIRGGMAVGR